MSFELAGDADPGHPLVGALLRFCLTEVEQRLCDALAAAGYGDIQVAHFKVFRFPPPENERPIDLAQRAGLSKQAMNYLLLQLEASGYIRRISVPGSSSRLVSLTEKGWKVAALQRGTVRQIEREWERRIGRERFQTFYAVLQELSDGG
ncbi:MULTISPECIES: MarR family winged helix-turn-helix transcriptional regulator [unclassified Achromobacter]|uniref:MarR family winged helix-turn-helix transcriptional regulator n=1 Tax=unclassified Achromobacter TaxID=2626865 RepID=UPI000B51C009|nr:MULTISPECIES: transcriptional regulator [unclassified Achromobacter]OWT80047.1 transcriptional regulator [Achromobacter sp. HZ34]OWT81930.1 transcriptional regulator [Achromobacter sp. HZ28]